MLVTAKKPIDEPKKPSEPQVVKVCEGTKTQGGTYHGHRWEYANGFALQIKAPNDTIYEFLISPKTEIILQDQINHTRAVMTHGEMQEWLTKNKSPELCT